MVSFGHMEPTTGPVSGNEPGPELFTAYGRHDQSPVLTWLPILFGLIASAVVALALCPVPRTQTVSAVGALLLAAAYVAATAGIGAAVLACGGIVAMRKREAPIWRILPFFCSVAAWMTPLAAFYKRDSLWAVPAGFVLSILGSSLIDRYYLASHMAEMFASNAEFRTDRSYSTRVISLSLTALVLEFGALSTAASMARPATVLISCAIIVISFFYRTANQPQLDSRFPKPPPFSITLGLAILLVAASLTPYLAGPTDDGDGTGSGNWITKPSVRSASRKVNFAQYVSSLFRRPQSPNPRRGTQGNRAGGASTDRPYPALQALFGEGDTASGSESTYWNTKLNTRRLTTLVPGDSEPGVILRPKITDHVTIVPPLPTRRVFDAKPNERTTYPVSIPFYGVYWVFKASDKTLPTGAVEMPGDPAAMSFKTTDFTPISMEARQNFGSLIKLSCCSAIELVIANGDRRPGTVGVELTVTNTTLPGQPRQSLGILPVNSSLHWIPADDRPPVTEVLSFRLPAHLAIQSFNEATIRFEMASPRERFSAKIAVQKFRLIPRVF
jgi:hypothetical protein